MKNLTKILFARSLIKSIHYPWRFSEKLTGKFFGYRDHYYIMKVFRLLGCHYFIDSTWPNPLSVERQLKFRLDLCQNTQQFLFRARGQYEFSWIQAAYRGLGHAECFLDIGANVGIFTVTLGQAMPLKKIVAIEALKDNVSILQSNAETNGLKNVEVLWAAVALESGMVRLHVNPIHDGGSSLLAKEAYKTGDIAIDVKKYQQDHPNFLPYQEVKAYRIDDLVQKKSILKIDVEGAEMNILESGRNSFKNGLVDMVIVEVEHETMDQVLQWFSQFDFDCFDLGGRTLLTQGSRLSHFTGNILCLKRGTTVYKEFFAL